MYFCCIMLVLNSFNLVCYSVMYFLFCIVWFFEDEKIIFLDFEFCVEV